MSRKIYTEDARLTDLTEETVSNKKFEGIQDKVILKNVTFEDCIFKNVNFENVEFAGVDFINVIFESCDLSNKSIDERLIKNVIFNNCRLSGMSFIDSFIKNTEFNLVYGRYLNMSGSNMSDVKIKDCDFSESSFIDVKIKKLSMNHNNFEKAEFLNTSLNNVDFSSSNITGVLFDLYSVKGMIVDSLQCFELMGLLGVKVK